MCCRNEFVNLGCPACDGQGGHMEMDWVPYGDTTVPMDTWEPCEFCSLEVSEDVVRKLALKLLELGENPAEIAAS